MTAQVKSLRALVLEQQQLTERIYQLCKRREDVIIELDRRIADGEREAAVSVTHENPLQVTADAIAAQLSITAPKLPLMQRIRDETAYWTNVTSTAFIVEAFLKQARRRRNTRQA